MSNQSSDHFKMLLFFVGAFVIKSDVKDFLYVNRSLCNPFLIQCREHFSLSIFRVRVFFILMQIMQRFANV